MSVERRVGLIAGALWAISLFLPVAYLNGEGEPGWTVLLIGWLALFAWQFAWLANLPFLALVIVLLNDARVRLWAALPTLLVALNSLTWTSQPLDDGPHPITFGVGRAFWWAAMATPTIYVVWRLRRGAGPAAPAA